MSDSIELLFFDTFSHETSEELNLDLVQFPKPVYVTEVRVIPLGARVQADFPGGVRLGATNPSQFSIEFFVNDLGKPGASTFESLGGFDYNQNGCIHMECLNNDVNSRQIPTDGLVLRGWYTTITLAVYGTLTTSISEQVITSATNTSQQSSSLVSDVQQIVSANTLEQSWQQDVSSISSVSMEYNQTAQVNYGNNYGQNETYTQDYHHMEYYNNEPPKDPRYHTPETEWDQKSSRQRGSSRPRDDQDHRDTDKHYSRGHSHDRDRRIGPDFPESSRDRDRDRDRDWDREKSLEYRDRERDRDRSYKHQDNYKRSRDNSFGKESEESRKRPRTPPMSSPKRPHTPHGDKELSPGDVESISEDEITANNEKSTEATKPTDKQNIESKETSDNVEESNQIDLEQFEPILSDEDICDEGESYQDVDYDLSAYTNNDDVIKLFNPINSPLQKYRKTSYINIKSLISNQDEKTIATINNYFSKYNDNLNNLINLLKPQMNKYKISDFKNLSPEVKEEFVNICEQLINYLTRNEQYFNFMQLKLLISEGKLKNTHLLGSFFEELNSINDLLLQFLQMSLDFDFAFSQNQPGYKIRHIKCGIRLTEACCSDKSLMKSLLNQNLQGKLINIFHKEYMALSIKLLILKVLDVSLSYDESIEYFVTNNITEFNGYQTLINILKNFSSARIKFAVNSLITKLNIYELLKNFKTTVLDLTRKEEIKEDKITYISWSLEHCLKLIQKDPLELSQTKRFLPVSAQFEINRSEQKNVLFDLFSMHQFLECSLVLLTHSRTKDNNTIITYISKFLSELLHSYEGLKYLSENIKCAELLGKCFLQPEDLEMQYILSESAYIKSQSLGLQINYKMQALYHIEHLFDLGHLELNNNEVLDELHSLYCLTFVNVGKLACSELLSLGDNFKCLLQFLNGLLIDDEKDKDQICSQLKKSAGLGYIVDLISITVIYSSHVPFLEKFGRSILEITQIHDKFETSTANKLNEISLYVKILENPNIFSYDDIKTVSEVIKQTLENVCNFPPELITALRILKHLGISNFNNEYLALLENGSSVELKYKYVILQLFSMDGVQNLTTILQKICDHFEQPYLHSGTFASQQGVLIMNIILPCVQLLRQMLNNVIQCRNVDFKDLTAVPVLLRTFNLAYCFPSSSIIYIKANEVCSEVINTLLVYTQPVSEEVSENDSLNKTLWTLMAGEVIKYITLSPYTFIPGLLIFSELLPLPLPFQSTCSLTEEETKRAVNLRKLWSAHLHSYSSAIQDFINRLSISAHQPLLHLLRRVCIQLSDLAANTAIMIARGVLDSLHTVFTSKSEKHCNGHTSRLLHFLACLSTHAAVKCAVLQLFWTHSNSLKTDEKYPLVLNHFCQILKTQSELTSHLQAQEYIVNIFQNFCDTEITLIQICDGVKSEISSDVFLANSLPPKEMLLLILSTLLDHFTAENSYTTLLPIVRTFILLSEHDYGFYHLSQMFEKKSSCFLPILKKISNTFSKENSEVLQITATVLDFLRSCCDEVEVEGTILFTPRSMKTTLIEMQNLIGWKVDDYLEDNNKHPLFVLESSIKDYATTEETMRNISDNLTNLLKFLTSDQNPDETISLANAELILPPPDSLLGQFTYRPVYIFNEISDKQLTTAYWLSVPMDESRTEADYVPCDLTEICRQHLPTEVNISREVEKLIRVFPSQETDRQTTDEIKNKRAVVDGQRNDKMKKPYVTPMRGRGFPRTAPQRGDLFRSRPPNTSRPPSLHVDDFVALETCGAQPTGPTGYNKLSRDLLNTRVVRNVRGRTFISPERGLHFRPL